jgi:GTP cyclohydrolase IA
MNTEEIVKKLIENIGDDPSREGLLDTPKRVAKSYETLFSGYGKDPHDVLRVFDGENYDEMIIVKDIEFYSFCEHHMIPFFGKVHVGYIPNGKIVGISKIPRMIEIFARRLQNQERLTQQVADTLNELLSPRGVGVVVDAKHLCMMARGVEKQNSIVTTSALHGLFKGNDKTRGEFLRLIGK